MWCKVGHVSVEILTQRDPRSTPCGFITTCCRFSPFLFRAKREQLESVLPERQGHNLALTVFLNEQYSLVGGSVEKTQHQKEESEPASRKKSPPPHARPFEPQSKSQSSEIFQILAIDAHKMARRTRQWLQEGDSDNPRRSFPSSSAS